MVDDNSHLHNWVITKRMRQEEATLLGRRPTKLHPASVCMYQSILFRVLEIGDEFDFDQCWFLIRIPKFGSLFSHHKNGHTFTGFAFFEFLLLKTRPINTHRHGPYLPTIEHTGSTSVQKSSDIILSLALYSHCWRMWNYSQWNIRGTDSADRFRMGNSRFSCRTCCC